MATLRYGEELLAAAPSNTSGLIGAEVLQDTIVSQRSGGAQVVDNTGFTVPITDGVPVAINPLLPAPTSGGALWTADANNRLMPNYVAAIPGLVVPAGYSKLAQVFVSIAAEKAGSGEDSYTFQADNDGVPLGPGITISLGVEPTFISLLENQTVDLDSGVLLGLTVTGNGTGDDIAVSAFEMFLIDFQRWSAPA